MASIIGLPLFFGSARTGGLVTPIRQSSADKRVPATFFFIAAENFFGRRPEGTRRAKKKNKWRSAPARKIRGLALRLKSGAPPPSAPRKIRGGGRGLRPAAGQARGPPPARSQVIREAH